MVHRRHAWGILGQSLSWECRRYPQSSVGTRSVNYRAAGWYLTSLHKGLTGVSCAQIGERVSAALRGRRVTIRICRRG